MSKIPVTSESYKLEDSLPQSGNSQVAEYPKAKQRSSNFELLRIVCMLMIICGHIIMVHGYGQIDSSSWYIAHIIRPFCCVAVNVFILISGYFGIKLNVKKLWSLNWMVTFYTVTFLLLTLYFGIHTFTPRQDWMQLVPVVTKQYWFITEYFALCLISPYLNKLIEILDKAMYNKMHITCFAIFCILPTFGYILNFKSVIQDFGYGLVNFAFLYMFGRYICLHNTIRLSKYKYLALYFVSMIILSMFQIFYTYYLGFEFDDLIGYNTFFIFFGSICLFMFFRELSFSSKTINKLAATCLAVYVIHINPLTFEYSFKVLLHVDSYSGIPYIILLFIAPLVIYLICSLVEMTRKKFSSLIFNSTKG